MKKFFAWILMLSMVFGLLCGCTSTTSSSRDRSERKDKEEKTEKAKVTIEETVVYDANDIKVTVTGLKKEYMSQSVKVLVENNSEYNIALSGDLFVVNGISMSGWLYAEVAPGKKVNDTITFYSTDMDYANIEDIATIDCVDARIVDTDSYDTLYEIPFSIQTSIADGYQQEIDESGNVLFQESDVTIIAKKVFDDDMGTRIILLVKNDTGKDIVIEADDVSVNDFTVDTWMYDTVMAGTVRFCALEVWSASLEENGIEDVEDVSFYIEVRYTDSWETLCESGELTVNVD